MGRNWIRRFPKFFSTLKCCVHNSRYAGIWEFKCFMEFSLWFLKTVTKTLIHINEAGDFVIMQHFSPWFLGPSIPWKKPKNPKPYHLVSYLSVSHAGCGNEGLLDGVALLKYALLLASHRPVTLNQKLDNLQVTSECSMDQSTLPILVQMIHLRGRTEKCMWTKICGHTPNPVTLVYCTWSD